MTPGLTREIWVEVTPDDTVPGDEVKQVLVTATSEGDGSKSDTVKALTEKEAQYRPDALIRNDGEPTYIGDGTYNSDGTNQTKAQDTPTSTTAVYDIELQNDGTAPDYFVVTGTAGGPGWTVRYKRTNNVGNPTDITTRVTGAGWPCYMPAGYTREIWVEVTPDSSVPDDDARDVLVTATSNSDGTKSDSVKAVTTHAAP